MNKQQIIDAYDILASHYEHCVDYESPYNTDYERPAMMSQLPSSMTGMNILDAGCAAGWYTEQFLTREANVMAIDVSSEMVAATKRRIGEKAEVYQLDFENTLPFADSTFDCIVSSLALHYIADWNRTFAEFERVLKQNGTLLFSVHHPAMDIQLSENKEYFNCEFLHDKWKKSGKYIDMYFYRRPLQDIINDTLHHFEIEKIIEPIPTEELRQNYPSSYEKLLKQPSFLIIKAKKKRL
ncbi:class I SAM-dependent methyltransferase [Bacillus cereus]|uniref:class I SAM-dependent methyltransferase n=1 Tax=Bacillus TaxID=1386 RepID=UPI000559263A|nr:class I SAM-dependent methyltransferase [Bacillus sp. UNC322MFChir4.1]